MATWMRTLWNGLLFRDEAFTGLRDRRDAFLQGFLIIVIVALVIGLPTLVGDLAKVCAPTPSRPSWIRRCPRWTR